MTEEVKPEEISFNSHFKADFPGVLEVSPSERLKEWLYKYYARIQTDTKPQFIFSIIAAVFIFIQVIFPALMFQACLQKDTSVIGSTIRFLSVIWIGGATFGGYGPQITSLVTSIITLLIFLTITFRAYVYSRLKSVKPLEITLVYGVSTFLIPILLSFTTSTIGISIDQLVRNDFDAVRVASLIIAVITFVLQCYFVFAFISPRVMFIRDVTLMWTPESAVLVPITSGVLAALFTAALSDTGIAATVELAVMVIYSIAVASYLFLDSMFINKVIGHTYSALLITNGTGNIINIASLYVKIDYNIIFFIIIVFVILSYLIFHFIMVRFSQISMTTLDSTSQDEYFYGRSDNLARDVRRSLDFCSPGVFMFTLYDQFIDDEDIEKLTAMLFVYTRVVSAFPSYKYKLEQVNEKIKESKMSCRRMFNFQIQLLLSHRNTAATSQIVKAFDGIDSLSKILGMNIKRFWENVLHGNTDTFWANIQNLNSLTEELNKDLNQIVNDYENCPEVISMAVKLHTTQTFNFNEARRLRGDLDLLEKGIPAHKDRALMNMMSLFPNVMNSISDLTKEIDIVGNALNNDVDLDDMSKKEVTSDLIKNSKIGAYALKVVYFIIVACISIGFFMLYLYIFKMRAFDEIQNTYSLFVGANSLLHSLSRFLFTNILHLAYSAPDTVFKNDNATMLQISPYWFPEGIAKTIDPTKEDIMEISKEIREELEQMSLRIAKIDASRDALDTFVDSYNNYKFSSTSQTISESITSIILYNGYDEAFLNSTFVVYDKLKSILSTVATKVTFLGAVAENLNYLVLTLLVTFFLFALPMMLMFFKLTIQMEEIATCFSTLPSPEIRKMINSDNKDDTEDMTLITTASVNSLKGPLYIGAFITLVPPVVLTYAFYFMSKNFILSSDNYVRSGAVLRTSMADLRMGFIGTMVAFLNAYPDADANKELVSRLLNYRNTMVDASRVSNSWQILLNGHQLDSWLSKEDSFRYLYEPLQENEDWIPIAKANWERLASYKYMMMVDNFIFLAKLTMPHQTTSTSNANYNAYFLWWVYDAVENEYYSTLQDQTVKSLDGGVSLIPLFAALDVIFTVIALIYIIYQLWYYTHMIKVAMHMLILIDLETIMSDKYMLNLIQTGRSISASSDGSFSYADQFYLNYAPEGICIVDKNLDIIEYNKMFSDMLPNCENVREMENDQLSIGIFNIFEGKGDVRFSSNINTTNKDGQPCYAKVEVIALNDTRPVLQNEDVTATSCALILQDVSKYIATEQKIIAKHKEITSMLLKILPENILNDLQNGQESVSFTVHSISIGAIQILVKQEMDVAQQFKFFATLYKAFDELMTQFSTLNKLKTSSGVYTYAGGLFMSINKPEKHAEEAVRFVVELVRHLPKLKEVLETDFSLKIGIHTGGPVIAGVLSRDFPAFQILGNIDLFTEKMMKVCEEDKVRVTRAVYELVFSAGFKITENEPMKIGTELVKSYTIDIK